MKERNFRSGGSSAAVKSDDDGVAVVSNPLSAEPPTRREFELQQRRIEEQQRQIDNLMKMVTALEGGLPAIGAGALLKPTESADATNTTIAGSGTNTTNDSSDATTGTDLGEGWARHFDEAGKAYYHNKLTGVAQWGNPMTGNEGTVPNDQSSLSATTTKPIANRRNSRRRSSFAKNRRRSSVKTALKASIAENQPGK